MSHECLKRVGMVHPSGPCECFRGGPAPEWPQRCPKPGCPREWVTDSLRRQCVDEGHVEGER